MVFDHRSILLRAAPLSGGVARFEPSAVWPEGGKRRRLAVSQCITPPAGPGGVVRQAPGYRPRPSSGSPMPSI